MNINLLFITIQNDTLNLADIVSMRVEMYQDECGEENPNQGFDLVVQMRGAVSPTRYHYASRDETRAQLSDVQQYMRARGFLDRHF